MLQISAISSGVQSHCCHYDVFMFDNLQIYDFSLNIFLINELWNNYYLHLKHEWRFLLNNEIADCHVNWEILLMKTRFVCAASYAYFFCFRMRISCSKLTDFHPSGRSELWNLFFFGGGVLVRADAFQRVETSTEVCVFIWWLLLCEEPLELILKQAHSVLSHEIIPIFFPPLHLKNGLISECYWIKQRMTSMICIYPPLHITQRLTYAE